MRLAGALIAAAALLAARGDALAQKVEVSADARGIYEGMPFALLVAAEGFVEDPEPEAPTLSINGCDVVFVGSSPRVSRSISVVNGRRSETVDVTFVFRYRVTPKKAGTFAIPPVEVKQGSVRARSRERSFEAKSVPTTPEMALQIGLPERPVWLGETFEATVDWYLARDPSRPGFRIPLFESDWVAIRAADDQAGRRRQTVTFSARDTGTGGDLELAYSSEKATLDGKSFTRLRFRVLVTPSRAGTLELEPAAVVAGLEVGSSRDRFGFPVARTEVFEARDEKRSLEIRPLPQSGRPAGFKNAVGSGFSIDVTASRTVVSVGDPVELQVTIKSDSRLDGMALPDLGTLLGAEHFGVSEEEPVGRVSDGGKTKVFLVTAQIKSKDVREIPRFDLAYFNPSKGDYEVARSEPIALQVAGSALVGSAQVTSAASKSAGDPAATAVSLVGADLALSSPKTTLMRPLKLSTVAFVLAFLYAAPVLLVGILWLRRKTSGTRNKRSANRARHRAIDSVLARAGTAPARESAAELAAALRALARETGRTAEGFDSIISDLDAEAYNPRGGSSPLSESLRERSREVVDAIEASNPSSSPSKAVVAILILGLAAGARAEAAGAESGLESARASYKEALETADAEARRHVFARSSSAFAELAAEYPDRPALLSDWGNASLGARELGWAVLAYRRALHLDRGQSRARSNLDWARGQLPEWAPRPDESSAVASLLFWHQRFSVVTRHLGAAVSFAIAVILLFAFARRRAWMAPVGAIFAVAFVALLLSALLEPDHSAEAVVVRDAETLRAADSPGAPAILSRPLPAGLEVDILETRERWSQVELGGGQRGWLPRTALRRVVGGAIE